ELLLQLSDLTMEARRTNERAMLIERTRSERSRRTKRRRRRTQARRSRSVGTRERFAIARMLTRGGRRGRIAFRARIDPRNADLRDLERRSVTTLGRPASHGMIVAALRKRRQRRCRVCPSGNVVRISAETTRWQVR